VYTAAWDGEHEPLVVVSRPYRSRAAAERAARKLRRRGVDAFARRFQTWSH